MSTSGSIREIVKEHEEEQCRKLNYQWSKDVEESNILISEMESSDDFIENNIDKINNMIERLNKELDYYSELGVALESMSNSIYEFSEIRRNLEKNYRTLSLVYYKYNFEKNKIQYIESSNKLNDIQNKQIEIDKKMNNLDSRIEGLGATFLNIVLTISIITTMVTVLLTATPYYSLVIILACSWLLLSSIIFIGNYFKKDKSIKEIGEFALGIYVLITLLTFSTLVYGICSDIDVKKIKDKNDEQVVEKSQSSENDKNETQTDNNESTLPNIENET